ncbi:organic solute transporter Ostalpha-domain-containing protein [Clohesyomyces aquaticus]|uniref:Organic solute transporter Ostalpha-domain-containing protein n=1 Tax=Clohesyomyces aquaticus TaxID=1231657 RepID=A0A1Y1ZPJ0_9PLEO|nr:organic solute transporter Ostalpha-domain-containing protein [Clohesyomyces aquaticus]
MDTILIARKLFGNKDGSDKRVCPAEDNSGPEIVAFVGNITFHTFASILSGACAILSCLVVLLLVFQHASNYSNPVQQRQIIRIILLVPWVAVFAFLCVLLSHAGEYLLMSLDFGCSIALSAFLLFLCDIILSDPDGFDALFGPGAWAKGQFTTSSPTWLKRTWYNVLQFIPVSIILWLATVISLAVGTYCATSNSPHFVHIWTQVIKAISTVIAIVAILKFYKRMKPSLGPHKVFLKLFAFKGIIGLNFLQTFILRILVSSNVIKPNKYLSYDDISVGLPSLALACEMPLFAGLLFYAFTASPYKGRKVLSGNGPVRAVVDAFNLLDILSAFVRGPMRLVREQKKGMMREDSVQLMQVQTPPEGGMETGYGMMEMGTVGRGQVRGGEV